MAAEQSRLVAFWASADRRATIWLRASLVLSTALVMSLGTTARLLNKPREVIRIGCDGMPAVVRLDPTYSEPNDVELRAFVTSFVIALARADSFSVVNDYVFAAQRMAPELREAFKHEARGTAQKPGAIAVIEGLRRRTEIAPSSLEIQIDRSRYPWPVRIKGVRQVVGEATTEPFELELTLVRASREELLEGLLVWSTRSLAGEPIASASLVR